MKGHGEEVVEEKGRKSARRGRGDACTAESERGDPVGGTSLGNTLAHLLS